MFTGNTLSVSGTVALVLIPPGACSLAVSATAATVYLGSGSILTVSNGFPLPSSGVPVTLPAAYPTSKGGPLYAFYPGGGTVSVSYWLSTDQ
jgi:hypothetical protein